MKEKSKITVLKSRISQKLLDLQKSVDIENRKVILDLLEEKQSVKVLDCGCGTGDFTIKIAKKGVNEVYGIELYENDIKSAKEKGIRVLRADLNTTFPFRDNSFDVVHSNQVIEHIYNTDGFILTMKVVKPETEINKGFVALRF